MSVSCSNRLLYLISVQPRHNTRSSSMVTLACLTHKSQIAPLGMRYLVYGMNSPLISASLVRHSLLHFHLSHVAFHHLHHLHYQRLYLLLLAQYFILNSRLGSSANPFFLIPFPFLPDWLHGLSDHLTILLCSTAGFVCIVSSQRTLNHCTFISFHFVCYMNCLMCCVVLFAGLPETLRRLSDQTQARKYPHAFRNPVHVTPSPVTSVTRPRD